MDGEGKEVREGETPQNERKNEKVDISSYEFVQREILLISSAVRQSVVVVVNPLSIHVNRSLVRYILVELSSLLPFPSFSHLSNFNCFSFPKKYYDAIETPVIDVFWMYTCTCVCACFGDMEEGGIIATNVWIHGLGCACITYGFPRERADAT